jgi:hypothetical protein
MRNSVIEDIITAHRAGIDRRLAVSRKEYGARWSCVQKAMRSKGYDLGYACGSELDRSDVAWLAGVIDPIIERYGVFMPARGKPVVVAGSEGGHVIADCLRASGASWTAGEKAFMQALEGLYHTVIKATAEAARRSRDASFNFDLEDRAPGRRGSGPKENAPYSQRNRRA